jgi:hypothetical protein
MASYTLLLSLSLHEEESMQELALVMTSPEQMAEKSPLTSLRTSCQQLSTQDGKAAKGPKPPGGPPPGGPPGGPCGLAAARERRAEAA